MDGAIIPRPLSSTFVLVPSELYPYRTCTLAWFFTSLLCLNFDIMAKLADCLKSALPSELRAQSIWSMIDPLDGRMPKHGQSTRRESTGEIFRECMGQRTRKRVTEKVRNSYGGSIVAAVRVGTYTTCVCKCKVV